MIWAGIDAGKTHHHCVVIDATGCRLLSRRVANDEPELLQLLADVLALGEEVTWAIDLADGGAALAITILLNHDQQVLYISGRAIHRACEGYRGEGKTDAKDAGVIADQARIRRDLRPLRTGDEIAVDLKLLTGRRLDLVTDRTRAINRLRALLTSIFPALDRALDLNNTGPVVLLSGYQTPAAIRRLGVRRLETWLRNRKVRPADRLAEVALQAAESQYTSLPGEKVAALQIRTLANEVLVLNRQVAEIERVVAARFQDHPDAEVIVSMPGLGPILGAEFVAATGGDMSAFATPDRLAGFGGVAPTPRDSGKISGNLRRPQRYNRRLQRVFYTSALMSIRYSEESRRFYDRKRAEGKRHPQAVMALARRRVNVLWALLRDRRCYQVTPPVILTA
ncbi:IS110 family transposase [Streptomyces melanogenes]|uniref:IS110 family transposase n=1 Tax=Streptomyces melanogenes TaxID=67326 RepID=UPI00167EF5D0|nr:IS110 family transposase [Streptomyces melanogenes]